MVFVTHCCKSKHCNLAMQICLRTKYVGIRQRASAEQWKSRNGSIFNPLTRIYRFFFRLLR